MGPLPVLLLAPPPGAPQPLLSGAWTGLRDGWEGGSQSFFFKASQVALVVRNLPASAGDVRDMGSVPESSMSPATRSSVPTWEAPRAGDTSGLWSHRVVQTRTQLKWLSMHASFLKLSIFYWAVVDVQCCVSFRCTAESSDKSWAL